MTIEHAHVVATVDVGKQKKRSGQRLSRCGKKGEILFFDALSGRRYYARFRDVRLGVFTDLGLAEQAILDYAAAIEETRAMSYPEIVEQWVSDIVDTFPESERREWFGKTWDPIAASLVRLGFDGDLTLDQSARLYGVSRQRIQQLEVSGGTRFLKELNEYRDHEPSERDSPMAIIEGGVW